jgi:cold shock protein
MPSGTVKWYNEAKGVGVIVDDDGSVELHVEHSAIRAIGYKSLYEGERVLFERAKTEKGRAAVDVVPRIHE